MALADLSQKDAVKVVAGVAFSPQSVAPTLGGNASPGIYYDSVSNALTLVDVNGEVKKIGTAGDEDFKATCRAASTTNLAGTNVGNVLTETAANGALGAMDGVTLVVGDRVLLKDQSTGADNGIWVVTSIGGVSSKWVFTRASDATASDQVKSGLLVPVSEGTVAADTLWMLTTNDPITLDTTALTFAQTSPIYASTGTIAAVTTSAAGGSSSSVARGDHAHNIATNAVVGLNIAAASTFFAGFYTGHNGAAAITLTGAHVGDVVVMLTNITDAGDGSASFESTISVLNQIQQTSGSDLSTKKYSVLLLKRS